MTHEEETNVVRSLLDDPGFILFNGDRWIDRDKNYSCRKEFGELKLVKFINDLTICAGIFLGTDLWIDIKGHKTHKGKDYVFHLIPSTFCEATKHLFTSHLQWHANLGNPGLAGDARNLVREVTKWAEENP